MFSTFLLVSSFRSCQSGPSCPLKQKIKTSNKEKQCIKWIPSFPMDFSDGSTLPTHPNTPGCPAELVSRSTLATSCCESASPRLSTKLRSRPSAFYSCRSTTGMQFSRACVICASRWVSVAWQTCQSIRYVNPCEPHFRRHHNHFYIETMAIGMATVDAAKAPLLSCNPQSWI